jgi:hypothetical protein
LTAGGNSGRYIQVGELRSLSGPQTVERLLLAGVAAVETTDGQPVSSGMIDAGLLRPARRGGRPVAIVRREGDALVPVKVD